MARSSQLGLQTHGSRSREEWSDFLCKHRSRVRDSRIGSMEMLLQRIVCVCVCVCVFVFVCVCWCACVRGGKLTVTQQKSTALVFVRVCARLRSRACACGESVPPDPILHILALMLRSQRRPGSRSGPQSWIRPEGVVATQILMQRFYQYGDCMARLIWPAALWPSVFGSLVSGDQR